MILKPTAFFLVVCLSACAQSSKVDKIEGLTIDPSIKAEAEKYFSESEFGKQQGPWNIYANRMFVEFYENDKLLHSTNDKEINQLSKSFYYWEKDTLNIDGGFGLAGGFGFNVKIIKGQAILYNLLASDEMPSYAYSETGPLIFRLEVACTETKIILSELPDTDKKQIIYGYVEFKGGTFYSSQGSIEGKEILPRSKNRINMRMYFKSSFFSI